MQSFSDTSLARERRDKLASTLVLTLLSGFIVSFWLATGYLALWLIMQL